MTVLERLGDGTAWAGSPDDVAVSLPCFPVSNVFRNYMFVVVDDRMVRLSGYFRYRVLLCFGRITFVSISATLGRSSLCIICLASFRTASTLGWPCTKQWQPLARLRWSTLLSLKFSQLLPGDMMACFLEMLKVFNKIMSRSEAREMMAAVRLRLALRWCVLEADT